VSYVDAVVDQIESSLSSARSNLDVLEERGPGIIRTLTNTYLDTFAHFPPFVKNEIADKLIAELRACVSYARKMVAEQEKLAHMLGSPDALRASASVLDNTVNKGSLDLASDVIPNSLGAMSDSSKWDGGSSQLYAKSFVGQNDEVARIKPYGQVLEDALGKLADAIEQYYFELVVCVLSAAAAIVQAVSAVVAAVGIITIPYAVGVLVGAIIAAIAAIGALVSMVFNIMQQVSDSIGGLHADLKPWTLPKFAQ